MTAANRTHVTTLAKWTAAMVWAVTLTVSATVVAQSDSNQTRRAVALAQFNTYDLTIPREQILSGGPPKDGIPSLTDPKAGVVEDSQYADGDRMVVVTVGDMTRAYPIRILNWHEAINDELGGVPIAVIYCPLCDSVSVVDRRLSDDTLEFGISGLLHNSNVLLYEMPPAPGPKNAATP